METQDTETTRVAVLESYHLLPITEEEKDLNELTELAANICGTPIALITLLDDKIQWFKSKIGIDGESTEKDISFCRYTIEQDDLMEVTDATKDQRFADNPFVTGDMKIRFYLGAPLINESGYKLGSLCVLDKVPRKLSEDQKKALRIISQQVINNFELRLSKRKLELHEQLLEEEVKLRTAELDRFVYSASHELRSPLKSILGLTELAVSEMKNPNLEAQTTYLYLIKRSTLKLDATINDLINYSKNSQLELRIEPLNMTAIVSKITENLTYYNPAISIETAIDIDETVPLYADRTRVEMILNNLISNAYKYQDLAKTTHFVSVTIRNTIKKSIVQVSDNGIGIEKECQDSIFKMFYRSVSDREGVGLGLYIVNEALHKLGGTCTVQSEFGKGSTFELILPNHLPQ